MSLPVPAEISRWQPHLLLACAQTLALAADVLTAAARRLAVALRSAAGPDLGAEWAGPAARRARESLRGHAHALTALAAALSVATDGLARGAPRLQAAADDAGRAAADLPGLLGLPGAPGPPGPERVLGPVAMALSMPSLAPWVAADVAAVTLLARARQEAAARAARAAADEVTASLAEADSRCQAVLVAQAPDSMRLQVLESLGADGLRDWLGHVPVGDPPVVVAGWWAAHSASEQRALVADPRAGARLGGLDGIPVRVRDRANRAALARRLAAGPAAVDRQVLGQLSPAASVLDPVSGRPQPPMLLVFRPDADGGRGQVALAYGDPGTAEHLALVVPGLGTRVDPDLGRLAGDATALWRTTRRLVGAPSVAVVAWLGYDTPDLAQVALDGRARSGAGLLAHAVDGLLAVRATNRPHVTLVGHSYGSVVTGLAVRRCPGSVDDLVVVGSPGVEAGRADELPLGAGHVWVGAASGDPVSRLSRFGVDPAAEEFGGRRFRAETSFVTAQHSHYFDEGSESLRAMALVVAGRADQVALADRRTDHGYVGALVDPLLPLPLRQGPDPVGNDPERSRRPHP